MAVRDTKNSGSHNASRKYGVICRQEEACIVRKMGVAEKDTAGLGSLGALFSCMRAGDTLCVPGVASFASSAGDLWMKMQSLSARGQVSSPAVSVIWTSHAPAPCPQLWRRR